MNSMPCNATYQERSLGTSFTTNWKTWGDDFIDNDIEWMLESSILFMPQNYQFFRSKESSNVTKPFRELERGNKLSL